MPPKRPRRTSPAAQGLSAGEKLKRAKLSGNEHLAWSWVGTEATSAADIAPEHLLATCGFSRRNNHPFCPNRYAAAPPNAAASTTEGQPSASASGELEDDIIVVSDEESSACGSKICKSNPNCLNYLGQEKWEDEGKARDAFMNALDLEPDPTLESRAEGFPVGLKNLGATCYANAFLQVWYQDLPFRAGVYNCEPSPDKETKFSESPIFQLQVTFAAMQAGKQSVFNPVKLVESLRLRTTEQQDAQEFSKLFMAHLDSEFQKQADPKLKSLVADQFQGKQVYTTVCSNCNTRSECESEFLELEMTLANNAKLEDRLRASLEVEKLEGDNKYLCSQCDSLQEAKRFTELRELPPVLHFSLLRFVYDLSTMERKKSKHAILFPEMLDMDQFVSAQTSDGKKRKRAGTNKYQLRGVLLHRGPSAYHGHYEAQIFDMKNRSWYQFNDEVVTKINSLRPQPKTTGTEKSKGASKAAKTNGKIKASGSHTSLSRNSSKEENGRADPKDASIADELNYISSRDAYMLIYARVSGSPTDLEDLSDPQPPPRATYVVEELNNNHEKACEEYSARETEAEEHFNQTRSMVMDIYRTWSLSHEDEDAVICSKQALEAWSSRHLVKPADKKMTLVSEGEGRYSISNEDATCNHGKLDPRKASNMKRIRQAASTRIAAEDHCDFKPYLTPGDACSECVQEIFDERLYQIDHPRLVSLFDEVSPLDEGDFGYWISKAWLKDWRLAKPKMHTPSEPDSPPDDPEYAHHVMCEHGGLTANVISRKRISPASYELLKELFPEWSTLSTDSELCAACEALIAVSREDRRGAKIQAEEEKAKLKHMHDNALVGNNNLLENVPCALVPAQFIRAWRQWLFHPANERPESVDTSQFICEHGLLVLDPNVPGDLDVNAAIIRRNDWETLEVLYSCGPLIAMENIDNVWLYEPAVCEDCRRERKSSYDKTEISIRLLRADDANPTPETYAKLTSLPQEVQPTLVTYGSRKVGGMRQSKRIRQVREMGRRRKLTITPETTVKELKIQIQTEWEIPTIAQRLYYRGHELADGSATLRALGVLSHDTMDLREESEDIDLLGSGSDAEQPAARRAEGRAFGGTLLGYSSASSPPQTPPSQGVVDGPGTAGVSCPACTYDNAADAFSCAMCETVLGSVPD